MALLLMEGFDTVNTYADISAGALGMVTVGGTNNYNTFETGRSGIGQCYRCSNSFNGGTTYVYLIVNSGPLTEFVFGFAQYFRERYNHYNDYRWFQFNDASGNAQVIIRINSSDYVEIWDYLNTTLLATSSLPISYNLWSYFEIKVKCNSTTGYIEIKLNGDILLSKTNYNTNPQNTGYINSFYIFSPQRGTSFDDMYLLDTTGSAPLNDYLGPVYVTRVLPTVNGSKTQFTLRSGATSSYAELDDAAAPDNDSTYVESGTDAHETLLKFPAQSGTTLFAVQVRNKSRTTTPGNARIGNIIKTYDEASNQVSYGNLLPLVTWADYSTIFTTAPDGTAWNFTKLNDTQFGIKLKKGL